ALLLPYFSLGGAFYNPTTDHWCKVPELENSTWTVGQQLNYSIPWEDHGGRQELSQCRVLVRDYKNVSALPWSDQLLSTQHHRRRPFTVQTLYGRRWVISVCAVLFAITSLGSALAPLYSLVLAGRFVLGMIHSIIGPAYVQGLEACPSHLRTTFGLLSTAPFAVTGMLFGAWAYFLREWRTLQLVCTAPVVLLLLQIPFMPESPRWLMLKGRCEEAAEALLKAARWHGVKLPSRTRLVSMLEKFRLESSDGGKDVGSYEEEEQNQNTSDDEEQQNEEGVKWPRRNNSIKDEEERKSTDPFLYMILSSLMEIPGYTCFTPVVARYGRRNVLAFNFAVCAVAILTILATPASYTWMVFSLALVGKLFITGSYGLLYLASSELFPTCVRSRGLNLSSMMARLGSIVSPFIIKVLATTHWWAPSVMFGVCAGVGSVFALLLPDSTHKPMTDTVDQMELLYGSKSHSSSSIEKGVKKKNKEEEGELEGVSATTPLN
ncbi:hypothetical protein Pcinc_043172, partial [Petrolisthes cinctipes]